MPYDAVSAYTVLLGDGDGPARVTVHARAQEAWAALHAAVSPVPRPRWRRTRPVGEQAARDAAERWRGVDPTRRYWQVTPHRLQVTVPAIAAPRGPAGTNR